MPDPGVLKRPLYPPSHPKGPVPDGADIIAIKRAISRAGFFPWRDFDDTYNEAIAIGVRKFQARNEITVSGNYGQPTHEKLKHANVPAESPNAGQDAFDAVAANLYKNYIVVESKLPNLGPVWAGGQSVLKQDLTHATSSIPLYPAFDDGFREGLEIIAPEPIEVFLRLTGASPGEAIFAKGLSKLQYWFGHLDRNHSLGTKFVKGARIARVAPNAIGGGPHVHVGVNIEALVGNGKELLHHTNYTHGAPTVGRQLEALL